MNRFLFPIKDKPLTEQVLRRAASYLAHLIIAYDFDYITHNVPDVRTMVAYLENCNYRALTQEDKREELREYFEELRDLSVPDSEHYQVFDASIILLDDVRDVYEAQKETDVR